MSAHNYMLTHNDKTLMQNHKSLSQKDKSLAHNDTKLPLHFPVVLSQILSLQLEQSCSHFSPYLPAEQSAIE